MSQASICLGARLQEGERAQEDKNLGKEPKSERH